MLRVYNMEDLRSFLLNSLKFPEPTPTYGSEMREDGTFFLLFPSFIFFLIDFEQHQIPED